MVYIVQYSSNFGVLAVKWLQSSMEPMNNLNSTDVIELISGLFNQYCAGPCPVTYSHHSIFRHDIVCVGRTTCIGVADINLINFRLGIK